MKNTMPAHTHFMPFGMTRAYLVRAPAMEAPGTFPANPCHIRRNKHNNHNKKPTGVCSNDV